MERTPSFHEDLDREREVRHGSDRSFGFVFAAVFAVVGLLPLWGGGNVRWWAVGVGAAILAVAFLRPTVLAPFNRLWFRFGLLLHKVVNPVIMALLFFGTVLPIGLIMRVMGKDPLRLTPDPEAESYWIPRTPPGPEPESLRNQF